MAERIRLVVLFGGRSAEHEVSCTTAVSVLQALDLSRYDVVPVGITHEGRWVLAEGAMHVLAGGSARALPSTLVAEGPEVAPLATITPSQTVVLPLLHGPFGEDGTIQGLCELAGVPYVGAGVLGSALAMDKAKAKEVLAHHGVPQVQWIAVREDAVGDDLATRAGAELGWPVFVKPANLGSSVGVTKADGPGALRVAVDVALSYDEWVVVEQAVRGREIEVGVLGDRDPQASVPGEIIPSREFYDYEDKYVTDGARFTIPAELPDGVADEAQRLAVLAFGALRAEGMARVDFFFESPGRGLLVNEVNTIPGFTPISMYPKLWAASGVPYAELIDRLVAFAVARHRRRAGRVGRAR
jgi:D-alanine-D-alanine ligase